MSNEKFHTIIVDTRGTIYHRADNHIQDTIKDAGLGENSPITFIIVTWDGMGSMPDWDTTTWNNAQKVAVFQHYEKLQSIMNNSDRYITYFYKSPYEDVLRKLALHSTNPNILVWLASDEDNTIREYVAANKYTPARVLAGLANDPSKRVIVASNPNTASHTLALLAKDKDSNVRCKVASNRHASYSTLFDLSQDNNITVCIALSLNPNVPQLALYALLAHPNKNIRTAMQNTIKVQSQSI